MNLQYKWNQLSYNTDYITKKTLDAEMEYFHDTLAYDKNETLAALNYLGYKKINGYKSKGKFITWGEEIYITFATEIDNSGEYVLCIEIDNYTYYKYIERKAGDDLVDDMATMWN